MLTNDVKNFTQKAYFETNPNESNVIHYISRGTGIFSEFIISNISVGDPLLNQKLINLKKYFEVHKK